MPRVPGLGPDSPIGRWVASSSGGRLTPRGLRIATLSAGLALGLVIVAMLLAMQVSSTPTFCGTCHIMKPYYQSWKHSKHNQIACVECHISPGITAELRKKYEALSMVVKYFTGTYSTNPWAEVDDAACLRCHERRLLEGKEVFHNVLFDHTPHLTESRRGLKLRCTSCHSQIVQGSHISVTSSTCALCHFKGQPVNGGSGRCQNCHQIPDKVTTVEGVAFDHSQVARLDMNCRLCHSGVVRGEGNVPRERCVTCHNQPDRLAKFGDRDYLHRMHVTEHKVDCMTCHLQIEHGRLAKPEAAAAGAAAGACESCHGAGHSAQQDLYAGIGGRGVPRMPGPMFAAGVTCQGCHNQGLMIAQAAKGPLGPVIQRANEVSCMSCHGPAYGRIYQAWKQGMEQRVAALRRELESSVGAMGLEPLQSWTDARHNFQLVEQGKGVHNVNFAYALLEQAYQQMNAARRAKGLAALERPWSMVSVGAGKCLLCHQGVESQKGGFAGHAFAHAPHLTTAKLDCGDCHRPHDQRAPGEVVRFGGEGCVPCHHRQAETAASACTRCHADVTTRTIPSFRGEFSHRAHLEMGAECGACHDPKAGQLRPAKAACAGCHGSD
ncbi:MAG: NapC/NirT family cytochrome c [Candidatus Eisenbacteria bacterium]|nr:NapC/NirT family cytochrome c [Candidatus Eisenbacteria bacterium]